MSSTKTRLLAGACALVGASALGLSANATTTIYGGGSSLLAPYWGQAIACFDSSASAPDNKNLNYNIKGTTALPQATTQTVSIMGLTCSPTTGTVVEYDATGSGTGQVGVFAHDAIIGTNLDATTFGATTLTSIYFGSANADGTGELFPSIQYGLSDNSLTNADVGVFTVGTGASYTPLDGSATFTTAASYQGMTFTSSGTAHNGGTNSTVYPIPKTLYGPLVQFPVSVDPVALAYNPSYKSTNGTTYTLQIKTSLKNADGSGGMNLDSAAYCAIFTGTITDWGNAALTALNGGQSLQDPTDTGSAPITIVGRSDSSGTSFIFTRHMANVCGSAVFGTDGKTTLPSGVTGLSNFVPGSGSSGVASAINAHAGAIGYIGPDFALPAVTQTGANSFGLNVADLKNNAATPVFVEPTPAAATHAYSVISAPSGTTRSDPTKWVQGSASTVPLANPTTTGAYPIVGTTNYIGPVCLASAAEVTALQQAVNAVINNSTVLSNAGLSQLPGSWLGAISNTFLAVDAPHVAREQFFAVAGTGSDGLGDTNTNCTVTGVVGG